MSFSWTPHRFVGGALALDVANSVILRMDPARSVDRFAVPEQLAGFADAASLLSAERDSWEQLRPVQSGNEQTFLTFREAVDRHFRSLATGTCDSLLLSDLLDHGAKLLRSNPNAGCLEAETVHSALRLLNLPDPQRLKICGHCGWLFLDRSKNKSRFWCDMAVCGNRTKASRHYRRKKSGDLE
ncbi:CGNR zinc finger domain-containing protein [Rhizobium sp. FKY42]|uniref:CGNR zinc finger domain-containing protein n=1 Tax=Rhizobium sp. FKY42 TaxID=2562310 RepID=UPI0010C06E41|nr:CGNR zinc finger domain-containing protein [Rhizobium sp. FKY42]